MNAVVQFKLGALRHERGEVTAAALQQLPGVGRYTAAAVASIAYQVKCYLVAMRKY